MDLHALQSSPSPLLKCLQFWGERTPDRPALWWQGEYTSYACLYQRVLSMALALAGVGEPKARIAVLSYNSSQFLSLLYAIPSANKVLVPLNARLAPAEWVYQLKEAGVSLLIAEPELLASLQAHHDFLTIEPAIKTLLMGAELDTWIESQPEVALVDVEPDSLAWLLYTSGTTGRPKGAMLSQSSLLAALVSGAHGRPVLTNDKYLYPFPLFHVAAHNVLLQHCFGACVVLLKSFDAQQVIDCCRTLQIDTLSLAPTMIAMLLDHPNFCYSDLDSVRTIGYGASAITAELLARLLNNSQVGLCQGYGMTELSGSIAFLDEEAHRQALLDRPQRLTSVGRIVPGVDIKLVNQNADSSQGEIAIKAKQTMLGYWQQGDATATTLMDGWLLTGDIGRIDDEGFLYLVDRKKDMIISGGENIASREIEDVLSQCFAIKQVAIVGTPDKRWGESVAAFVQLHAGVEYTAEALRQYCRQYLAGYKIPKHIAFVKTLETNAAGKMNKQALRLEAKRRFASY